MAKDWKYLFARYKLYVLLGLKGVSEHEARRTRRMGRFFTLTAVVVAILLLLQWQLDLLGQISPFEAYYLNWGVWLFLAIQYVVCLSLVKDKRRYIRQNWMLPVLIVLGVSFLVELVWAMPFLRGFRPLFALILLMPAFSLLAEFFVDGQLRTTLLAATIIVFVFGFMVAGVDPNIKTAWDGVWWALATVSTVGYGDVVPTSALGRLLGAGLVVMGLGIFVVITANFLAIALRKEKKELREGEQKINDVYNEVAILMDKQDDVIEQLKTISKRLENLESNPRGPYEHGNPD